MRQQKRKLAALLTVLLFVSSVLCVPISARAVWIPNHNIPAYQQKNIFETETVTIKGISVEEVVNASVSPMITKAINEAVTFKIFNSTTQEIEQEVTSQNGVLAELKLKKNHNYIFFAEDSNYRMPNVYVWVKGNQLVDIKNYQTDYEYPILEGFRLYKRDTVETNPSDDRRVMVNLPVITEGGAPLYNVSIRLVSDVETLELNSGSNAKIQAKLLEDVNYMIEVEHDTYGAEPIPISVKDKSEYGAGKYPYNHSNCNRIDNIVLVKKNTVHKNDSTISNTNYDDVYKDYYTNIAGKTTVTGMNFNDFIVLENKINKNFDELNGKEYEVFDIKIVNPHRWEVAKLSTGEYKVTKLIDEDKQVGQVYVVKNDALQRVEFEQLGNEVNFTMNSMSLYPIVIEYKEAEPMISEVISEVVSIDENSATAKVTVRGTKLPEELFYHIFYKQEAEQKPENPDQPIEPENPDQPVTPGEPEMPAYDNTMLNIKVQDESGNPVSGIAMYLKYGTGRFGNVEIPVSTDQSGRISYSIEDLEDLLPADEYELVLVENDDYTCDEGLMLTFGEDNDWNLFLEYVGDDEYTEDYGEIILVVRKTGSDQPVEPEKPDQPVTPDAPTYDNKMLNIKVQDESGNPISGIAMYLKYGTGRFGNVEIPVSTDQSGRISYPIEDLEDLLPADEYELVLVENDDYTCDEGLMLTFGEDDDWNLFLEYVGDDEYTEDYGEIILVVRKTGSDQPVEPEKPDQPVTPDAPTYDNKMLNIKVQDESGNPISGIAMYLKYGTGRFGNVEIPVATDQSGRVSYPISDLEDLLPEDEYELVLVENDDYICDEGLMLTFGEDDDWNLFLEYVGDDEYTEDYGEIILVVRKGTNDVARTAFTLRTATEELSEWIAVEEPKSVITKGTVSERTFEIELPFSEYPEALRWTVKVALTKEDADAGIFAIPDKDMVIENNADEKNEALEELKEIVKAAEKYKNELDEEEYTADSWKEYCDAIEAAKQLFANKDAEKDDYINAANAIKTAQANLKEKEVVDPGNDTGNRPDKETDNKVDIGEQNTPKTGDPAIILPMAISLLAAMMVILNVLLKKRAVE